MSPAPTATRSPSPAALPTAQSRTLGTADLPVLPPGPLPVTLALAEIAPGVRWMPQSGAAALVASAVDGRLLLDGTEATAGSAVAVPPGAALASAGPGPARTLLAGFGDSVTATPVGGVGLV